MSSNQFEETEYSTLEEVQEGVFVLTLKQKAFDEACVEDLNQRLDQLDAIEGALSLVTTSSNPKIYSAGLNLKNFENFSIRQMQLFLRSFQLLYARILKLSYPTIAAINGHCYAGGLMFAMAHDYRFIAEGEFGVCLSEINLGMSLPFGMSLVIRNKVPHTTYRELALFGVKFTPRMALEGSVVDRMCSKENLVSDAISFIAHLKEKSIYREEFAAIKCVMNQEAIDAAEKAPLPIVGRFAPKL